MSFHGIIHFRVNLVEIHHGNGIALIVEGICDSIFGFVLPPLLSKIDILTSGVIINRETRKSVMKELNLSD